MSNTKQTSALRRRLACDRCHSFKLKCPRPSLRNDDTCARCLKAGVACSYSPSMRGQVRPKQMPALTTSSIIPVDNFNKSFDSEFLMPAFDANDDIFDNMVMDWAVPEDGLLIDNFESTSQLQPSAADASTTTSTGNEVVSSHKSDGNSRDDQIHILEHEPVQRPKSSPHYLGMDVPEALQSPNIFLQLTNMSLILESLARQLPSFRVHDQTRNTEETQPELSQHTESDDEVNFGVGKTYAMTHKLADIYVSIIEPTEQRKQLCHDNILDPIPMDSIDCSLLWLLFSCHNRLVDLWHAMLLHAKMVHDTDTDSHGHKARCARFKMGSYEPSSSSTVVAMEIIVLQELAMHLAARLNDLIAIIESTDETNGSGDAAQDNSQSLKATVLMAKALHERALAMRTEISQLKSMLEDSIAKRSSARKGQ
ncbi:hypothetical protein TSTA_038010 [Talaromyces stipitatus ATCC 10500]|uniref:Zn(2)-C6 fungal-type domain-containing protein n=1 Tax=Talaromyces stipitatus (strain ATCC 10500 / CBS 375.48 / QM 6759 / NRRL 1006) TaxID=441959 RepID=B8M8S6_TALSN|nr:uncharacterized protein TSTA_038010 [Talaromyces stipitatus ATCC 10500]EED20589.1 hypothetical protein TSTA_038010 [Talaromyces stipitatus ATCC 10500]